MRRTDAQIQATAIPVKDYPQTGNRLRRFLYTLLLLFVAAGVSAIACFMFVLLPRQNALQVDGACVSSLQTANIGDSVFLGSYEQDNNLSDGAEQIEWIVLSKQENRALLISKYALDYAPFNTDSKKSTWDYSTLLHWLNDSFYTSAFTPAEKTMVRVSDVRAEKNIYFKETDPGQTTRSRIFLLSLEEANTYFQSSKDRQCQPTAYAEAQGASALIDGSCSWWLRTPGYDSSAATRVLADGGFGFAGQPAERSQAIRPAMWVEYGETESI